MEYQKLKHFHFNSKNIKDVYSELKNNYFKIKDKELDEYNPNEEKFREIKIKIKDHFNIQETNSFIPIISKLYLFILDNIDRYKIYKNSNAKQFLIDIKKFILNVKENYYRTLTGIFKQFLKDRVYIQLINLKFYIKEKNKVTITKEEALKIMRKFLKNTQRYLRKKFLISKLFVGKKNLKKKKKILMKK